MRINVRHGHCGVGRELPFCTNRGLHQVWSFQGWAQFLRGLLAGGETRCRRDRRKEVGIRHHRTLLAGAVVTLRTEDVHDVEPLVKEPKTSTKNGARGPSVFESRRPGESHPRRKIASIMQIRLPLVSQPGIHRQVRLGSPGVSEKQAEVLLIDREGGIPGVQCELRRATAQRAYLGRRHAGILKYKGSSIGFDGTDGGKNGLARWIKNGLTI